MRSFRSLMAEQVLLPIIQAETVEQGVQVAKAMRAGGIHLVEVVLRTEASLQAMIAIKKAFPDMIVGAGTVVCTDSLKRAINAGADFIVTPAITPSLGAQLAECGVPVLPGVANVADILTAREFGFKELKLFPASLAGGAKFIAAMSGLFSDTYFCPTGGVNQANKADYLSLGNCFAVGGTWVADTKWVAANEWHKVTQACQQVGV
ncbi:bifunctional 4-hydroxy-2-oxoglutarate aldolase/2-dehydro-3-deoxy-phosphogluconate aldolase [Psychrosphaera sp. 1_MG-2023]|uniref:bifunctional 4-hydroxy-2-oxoglutarate aldolase/2-dehydro-3-deoxy-phosphogluconate aldolase n=1 Tax=Psychrosphaera sp. 1_MG-2023 TaxID=3062643 RepID=UPI0026E2561B|nr:bifunctional 4-hydroxy-2-oxoglutarate aldolase/2-dehydro-3-deoxy-phosphogluconate aldolase [Psychrosphaera sp. 1_MG-2023]MDO6718764.1 bifunctional 4-hydroxy-2-oxoglutarate aldolase/2-dehydro-3-deoxy-phosphogluconate aldolase [Psychrosphaera sp. 1_MG-2023]